MESKLKGYQISINDGGFKEQSLLGYSCNLHLPQLPSKIFQYSFDVMRTLLNTADTTEKQDTSLAFQELVVRNTAGK